MWYPSGVDNFQIFNFMGKNVVILGAGEIGAAIGKCLKRAGHNVDFWDAVPGKVRAQKDLDKIVPKADFLFLCVPTFAVRPAITGVLAHLKRKTIIVSLAKGIEDKSLLSTDQIISKLLPKGQAFAIFGGPMLAEELIPSKGGVACAGTSSKRAVSALEGLFRLSCIKIEHCADMHGVALCGVFKNIYAMGLGAVEGMRWPDNLKGWYIARASDEIARLLVIFKANKDTIFTSAGLGDFLATGLSSYSGHHTIGETLARTGKCEMNRDGCKSIKPVLKIIRNKKKDFPMLLAIESVFIKGKNLRKEFGKLVEGN
ncbi:MAG: NAD(P)-dependent oxidoreductase [Patescibacteria group bacterium]